MNKVMLVGRLSQAPENLVTMDGVSITRFSLAVQRNKDEVDFIRCVAFEKQANAIYNYCKKGFLLGVVGRLQTRSYEKNGEKRSVSEVIVEHSEFLTSKKEAEGMTGSVPSQNTGVSTQTASRGNVTPPPVPSPSSFDDAEIPF